MRTLGRTVLVTSSLASALSGCSPEAPRSGKTDSVRHAPSDDAGAPAVVPDGAPSFCYRPGDDQVRDLFCKGAPRGIRGLRDLEVSLGLGFPSADAGAYQDQAGLYFERGSGVAVFLGHSTALSGDVVSSINPRAIVIGPMSILAFNRGVQQAEIAANDRERATLNFYLVSFEQACTTSPGGCKPGDLYTPRIESNWTSVRVEDAEDLKNTPSDCRQCHQRGRDAPLLLMREVDGPWTHFFGAEGGGHFDFPEATGTNLLEDYLAAKGDESYAGVPSFALRRTAGLTLEDTVGIVQPLVFDGVSIMNERWPYSPEGYPATPLRSATWDAAFDAFRKGEQLALPFYAPRATEADKLARLTAAYRGYRDGTVAADDLPDLGDAFPDDPGTRAEIGFQTEPGATPRGALVQACGSCHNDVLDQSISRARFNVALARMDRAELDLAVERIQLPRDAPGAMPPRGRRQLDRNALPALADYLRRDARPADDDAFLEHAAVAGMAGPSLP